MSIHTCETNDLPDSQWAAELARRPKTTPQTVQVKRRHESDLIVFAGTSACASAPTRPPCARAVGKPRVAMHKFHPPLSLFVLLLLAATSAAAGQTIHSRRGRCAAGSAPIRRWAGLKARVARRHASATPPIRPAAVFDLRAAAAVFGKRLLRLPSRRGYRRAVGHAGVRHRRRPGADCRPRPGLHRSAGQAAAFPARPVQLRRCRLLLQSLPACQRLGGSGGHDRYQGPVDRAHRRQQRQRLCPPAFRSPRRACVGYRFSLVARCRASLARVPYSVANNSSVVFGAVNTAMPTPLQRK